MARKRRPERRIRWPGPRTLRCLLVRRDQAKRRHESQPLHHEIPGYAPHRLFELGALGEGGWLKALRLEGYAPRATHRPTDLQQTLFPYHEAWG